jgi:hypothetical protein
MARVGWFTVLLALLPFAARAHNPDTSYARIDIAAKAVEFTFTYDYATLNRIISLDTNRDSALSREELAAATPAIERFLRRTIYLELNERDAVFGDFIPPTWPNDVATTIPASDFGQRLAIFKFRNAILHAPDSVAVTFDFFREFGERHTILGNFVWNGAENEVIFTRFEPDYLFDTGYRIPALEQFTQYLKLGVEHIFRGYDHVAFLLALLFVRRFVDVLKIVTAFSVAHTITLALAALQIVTAPPRLVESLIAASIVYVALENLFREATPNHRWKIAGAFGLVHGFGFATILSELGLPATGLVQSLLAFNLGVELGQIAIAGACWPFIWWIAQKSWAPRVRIGVAIVLIAFGSAWFVDRAFALNFMPM